MSLTSLSPWWTRPNFFPGQRIDYRDFNRLAEQADKMLALVLSHLYAGGGIVAEAWDSFQVVPLGGLQVRIRSGIGLLPTGHPVVLTEDRLLDLSAYVLPGAAAPLVVSIANAVRGKERYTDAEDPSITGYRSEAFEPEFRFSEGAVPDDALELFRVHLGAGCRSLSIAQTEWEWESGAFPVDAQTGEAPLDFRFRKTIVPQTYVPLEADRLTELRKTLYQLDQQHRKIAKLYLVEDGFGTSHYLSQVHAELLQRPIQPLKLGFLLSEFAEKLSLFLESVLNRVGHQKNHLDRNSLLQTIALLDEIKTKEVLPRSLPLACLPQVSGLLETFLNFAEAKFSLLDVIEEAMLDMKHRGVEFSDKLVLAGHLFERVDAIEIDDDKKWDVRAEDTQTRRLVTQFKNGDKLALKGVLFQKGEVTVKLKVPQPDRPLVLFCHQYIRRAGCELGYEINAKPLLHEKVDDLSLSNHWINKGFFIPSEFLVQNENVFKIVVEKTDLDFGFFDLFGYQPVVERKE